MSLRRLAAASGIPRSTLARWAAEDGCPVDQGVPGLVRWLADRARRGGGGDAPPAEPPTVPDADPTEPSLARRELRARARKREAEARRAELDLAEREGQLLPADEVAREWSQMLADIRQRLLALPSRAVAEVRAAASLAEADDVLRGHVYQALEELSAEGDEDPAGEGDEGPVDGAAAPADPLDFAADNTAE